MCLKSFDHFTVSHKSNQSFLFFIIFIFNKNFNSNFILITENKKKNSKEFLTIECF